MRLQWLLAALALSLILSALEGWATVEHLYWRYVWFDTIMHFLGGMVVGTLAIGILIERRTASFIAVVAVIALGWEIFEFLIGSPRAANFALDTAIDLTMDVLGATFIYVVAHLTLWRKP